METIARITKKRIAVEGLTKEIVSIVCEMLERLNYDICYRHQSAYKKSYDHVFDLLEDPSDIIENIVKCQPDPMIICNASGYFPFLKHHSETTDIPLLVLTGSGPGLIDELKRYTPHVLEVPFRVQDFYNKTQEILG